jgi:hypothetical protein
MAYADPNHSTLAEVLAMAPEARQDAIVNYFHKASAQHNPLMRFTSTFDPNAKNGGPKSVFCQKTDLRAGGKSKVHFNTIGMPAGPGSQGNTQLVGRESKSTIGTYHATVDWVRDAVSLSRDEIEMIEAGRKLGPVMKQMLAAKMGLTKLNHMLKRLLESRTSENTYRVGNRASTNALTADDTLSLDVSNISRAMLNTIGATPLQQDFNEVGSPVSNYMLFATDQAFLPIRNDSLFSTAKDADVRGPSNVNWTGRLLDHQGNPNYEFPVTDMAWDDYKGGPLIAKAKVGVEAKPATAGGAKLIVNSDNALSRYFQWFDGHPFQFSRQEALPNLSGNEYYFWACNPDGSRVFGAYSGLNAVVGGNQITITKILCPAQTGTTIDQVTVGQLSIGASAAYASGTTGPFTPGGSTSGNKSLPTTGPNGAWVYTDTIAPGAVILQANSQGVVYGRSFMLASMAGVMAHGNVEITPIQQNFDYDFVKGQGFMMIFGTGVVTDPDGRPNGYICIEHALDVVGYPCPAGGAPVS